MATLFGDGVMNGRVHNADGGVLKAGEHVEGKLGLPGDMVITLGNDAALRDLDACEESNSLALLRAGD